MRPRHLAFVLAAFAALLHAIGCEDEAKLCYPGEYLGCYCADATWGYARCVSFEAYGPCECVGTPGLDAGGGGGGGGDGGGGGGGGDGGGGRRADAGDAAAADAEAGG